MKGIEVHEGIIIKTLEHRSGVSQYTGDRWESTELLFGYFKTQEDKYLTNVAITTFNRAHANIPDGTKVQVSYYARSREYQGKWYTQVNVDSLKILDETAKSASPAPTQASAQSSAPAKEQKVEVKVEEENDLPF